MAAKTPDSVSMRFVQGSQSMFIMDFSSTNLDNTDTVDVSPYLSTCEGAIFQPSITGQTSTPGIAFSGSGNVTLTFALAVDNVTGKLFIFGNP